MGRKYLYILITAVISLSFVELGAFIYSFFIPQHYYYIPPTRKQFKEYLYKLENKDELGRFLGWGDEGIRPAPAARGLGEPYISLYGDSFTYGMDVSEAAAWGNVLTALIGRRVDNYGNCAYGSDQAYLYFFKNLTDKAKVVILTHLSENIVRNINQDRSFIYRNDAPYRILLKPRLTTDKKGRLEYIKVPKLTESDYENYVRHPETYLKEEFFIPNKGWYSLKKLQFPYSFSVPYVYTHKRIFIKLLNRRLSHWFDIYLPPWYDSLYEPNHPSGSLELTRDIMINFARVAKEREKIPLLFVLPSMEDFAYFQHSKTWVYSPLLEALKKEGYDSYDLGPLLLKKLRPSDKTEDFFSTDGKAGHYSSKGNKVLAEVVRDILKDHKLIDSPGTH